MARDYSKIDKDVRDTGFFSEYLPPCFELNPEVFLRIPPKNCDLIPAYSYTMSRFNGNNSRRNIYIPEIGAYAVVHNFLKENSIIQEIIEFTENYTHSFSPILGNDDTLMRHEQSYSRESEPEVNTVSTYIDNIVNKIIRASGAKSILKLDISNCFSSFYCHMMPAIMLGIENTEEEFRKSLLNREDASINPLYTKYRELDETVRRQTENRTNGLLIGPLSSKIIVEGLLTRIDIELESCGINFSRYVDDYEVYIYDDNYKQIISTFSKILRKYGFSLNNEKTEIVDFPYYVTENLDKIIDAYNETDSSDDCFMGLFNSFFEIEENGTKGAIRYLLKTIEKNPIKVKNHKLMKAYLLSILNNNERSLTKACSLLIQHKEKIILNSVDIDLLKVMLKNHLSMHHDLEVLWILYVLIECNKIIQGEAMIESIVSSDNELAHIMLFRRNLLNNIQEKTIVNKAKSWILLYELFVNSIITEQEITQKLNLNKNLEMYRTMKNRNIHFCN